ncbi:CaiB/BaiF CoA-transferase family protein [Nocardioides sp. cx-173]|uniref:CaiB/BaiF CoA transferase family protein n=1 Tax=Nocardioides sp. cx-173 TaxID=2898796 RepID=UPI001E284415|nr:CoA transferase [Nocardioides sp. cx-173]MCD4526596.1 CoA transferase [Nocardioides sp. cx-173]UGB40691.1 CoA transferase [Nocardioides sp. cx-173]
MTHDQIPTSERPGSLHGLRVIELSTSVAGPMCGQVLGDLGAEVIKVERVGHGDDTRAWAPPAWNGVSTAFLGLNRNKQSIELDFKTPRGAAVLEELIKGADVLVQNLRPQALAKAGFTWERIQELNPRLVYLEMTGFGPVGPRAEEPAYDPLLQAFTGIVAMMPEGSDGSPSRVPLSILDKGTAMWAVIGVLEALRRRDQEGVGSHVNVSLLNTALEWVAGSLTNQAAGNKREKLGSGFPGVVPYGAFPTSDGHIFIAAGSQRMWLRLLDAIGHPELDAREGFGSNVGRSEHRAEVVAALSEVTSTFERDEIAAILLAAGVPNAPVRAATELATDPQVIALGAVAPLPHPQVPDFAVVGLPMQVDGENLPFTSAPPLLGADTRDILSRLGMTDDEVQALIDEGVVGATEASVAAPAGQAG